VSFGLPNEPFLVGENRRGEPPECTGSRQAVFYAYGVGGALMVLAAIIEAFLGVRAERQSLESIATPLSGRPQGEVVSGQSLGGEAAASMDGCGGVSGFLICPCFQVRKCRPASRFFILRQTLMPKFD
jgi:hypothetical protein